MVKHTQTIRRLLPINSIHVYYAEFFLFFSHSKYIIDPLFPSLVFKIKKILDHIENLVPIHLNNLLLDLLLIQLY